MTSSSPWWGVPLITGAFVFLGVAVAQAVTLYLSRRSRQREDERRWDEERRRLYSDILREARDLEREWSSIDPEEGLGPVFEIARSLRPLTDQVQLLSSQSVIDASTMLQATADVPLVRYEEFGPPDPDGDDAVELSILLMQARMDFLDRVRTELGITQPERGVLLTAERPMGLVLQSLRVAFRLALR